MLAKNILLPHTLYINQPAIRASFLPPLMDTTVIRYDFTRKSNQILSKNPFYKLDKKLKAFSNLAYAQKKLHNWWNSSIQCSFNFEQSCPRLRAYLTPLKPLKPPEGTLFLTRRNVNNVFNHFFFLNKYGPGDIDIFSLNTFTHEWVTY